MEAFEGSGWDFWAGEREAVGLAAERRERRVGGPVEGWLGGSVSWVWGVFFFFLIGSS